MADESNKGGRPSLYTPELIERICERLETGEPMAQICRDEGMPSVRTVTRWTDERPGVSASIARARQIGFDAIAVDALRIADQCRLGVITETDADGKIVKIKESDMVDRARLQVHTRLQLLAKWDPKRYGDKLALGGAEGLPPVQTITRLELVAGEYRANRATAEAD